MSEPPAIDYTLVNLLTDRMLSTVKRFEVDHGYTPETRNTIFWALTYAAATCILSCGIKNIETNAKIFHETLDLAITKIQEVRSDKAKDSAVHGTNKETGHLLRDADDGVSQRRGGDRTEH